MIHVSHRREQDGQLATRIRDRLEIHFGRAAMCTDLDDIPAGGDRDKVRAAIERCDVIVAVVGDNWPDDPAGRMRIDIQSALERGVAVVPVLVGGAAMPREDQLPAELKAMCTREAVSLPSDGRFYDQMDVLIRVIEDVARQPKAAPASEPPAAPTAPLATPAPPPAEAAPKPFQDIPTDLAVGQVHQAVIDSVMENGLFFVFRRGTLGLVHKSDICNHVSKSDCRQHFKVGEQHAVKVIAIDEKKGRIALSMREAGYRCEFCG